VTPTVVLIPGLRGEDADHWQTRLAAAVPGARLVPPLGRGEPSLDRRVAQLDRAIADARGPVVLVGHSAGVLVTVHWAARHAGPSRPVTGALLATPPTLDHALPAGYPSISTLREHGWMPIPRTRLAFRAVVATSDDDELGNPVWVASLARAWGARLHPLGPVGHLNPASGYGEWPGARPLIEQLGRPAERVLARA
jgi:predicted alpha/beta hydrolase family esterase